MPSSSTRPPQHLRPEPPEPQVLRQFHQGIVEVAEEAGAAVVGAHRLCWASAAATAKPKGHVLRAHRGEKVVAGRLAAAAGLGAQAAVLHAHVAGVSLALIAARTARPRAGQKDASRRLQLEGRLAREDPAGRPAQVGAVQAEPYAAGQVVEVLFAEAGVRAGGAGLGAVKAGFYAL